MYRNTYININLDNIKYNVKTIINKYNNYKYYIGVVKASCYGFGIQTIKEIIEGGCNYLAVSSLDEAIEIRNIYKEIPILCLGIIDEKYIDICIKNNITITISNIDYLNNIIKNNTRNLKVHIKINTGMNRLGLKTRKELNEVYKVLTKEKIEIEGIYTHIYNPDNTIDTNNQYTKFEEITKDIDLSKIKIVHVGASIATTNYKKKDYSNGCRLGIIMYGLENNLDNTLKSCYSLQSEVIQINTLNNETLGYNGTYKSTSEEKIAVVSIGYRDGIIRKNKGRYVYINNKEYQIVGNICMDMLFVKVDNSVKVKDKVYIIKDNFHIQYIANYLDTISYEVLCNITNRVPRIYNESNK